MAYAESVPDPDSPLSPEFQHSRVSSVSEVSLLVDMFLFVLKVQGQWGPPVNVLKYTRVCVSCCCYHSVDCLYR